VTTAEAQRVARPAFDPVRLRADFPILSRTVHGKPLVYLDNAATTQKPRQVLDAVRRYYEEENANVHRGVHLLSELATKAYEGARKRMGRFLGTPDPAEIIFVRGTTEAVNLVAHAFLKPRLSPGDEILLTVLEHHSNIVPWQLAAQEKGAKVVAVPISDDGDLDLDAFDRLLGPRTKLLAVGHVSNALGTVNPVAELVKRAHARGVPVLVDGAQAAPHLAVDVTKLGADFYALSGHKMYAPTGIGILWGRREHLEAMSPWQGGGDMIRTVAFEGSTWAALPHKLEAGTPHISGAVGLAAAADYLEAIGLDAVAAHEHALLVRCEAALRAAPEVRVIGAPRERAGALSFLVSDVHPHDIGTILDREGVAVRAGHHCAQPLMKRLGVPATARASFGLYNTEADVDALVRGVNVVREVFAG